MKEKDGTRRCDVCREEIPKKTTYRISTMPAHAAELLMAANDPDLTPTWTTNPDGTVRLDICLDCVAHMAPTPGTDVA